MKKKLVALVLIALLSGLGGGYGLGYVMYQPQISTMQSDIYDIQSLLFQNKTWHIVAGFNLSADGSGRLRSSLSRQNSGE